MVTKQVALNEGTTYYVSMQASDAGKGAEVYYRVTANLVGASNASALAMPEMALADVGFAQDNSLLHQTAGLLA